MKYPELFQPFNIGKLRIKNRIAMAPMHLGGCCDSDGNLNEAVIDYFEARAKGGVGLIYTCGFAINSGVEETYSTVDPMADVAKFKITITRLTERLHAYDTKLFVEIGPGSGRVIFPEMMTPKMNGQPVAPSAIPNRWNPDVIGRPLTREEVQALIDAQIKAAVQIKEAGADGICIGGPYGGYFPDQFMTRAFNLRDDEFGYDGKNGQNRVVTDVIRGIKKACGNNFPVTARLTPKHYIKAPMQSPLPGEDFVEYGRDIDESIELARDLERAGVDSILIGNGSYDSFYWLYPPTYQKEGLWLEDAKKIKDAVTVPVVCPGKINTPEMARDAVRDGYVDCVAIGRPSLADAEWANKAHAGADEDIRPCIGCQNGCIGRCFTAGRVTCAVNPQVLYEKTDPILPAQVKKRVLVIGGGIGGMEAARVAALRGHEVHLYEQSDKLGGLFNLAAVPSFKAVEDRRLLNWYARAVEKAGVHVHLNTRITAEEASEFGADEIIVATGATAKAIPFPGLEQSEVITASDVLSGKEVGKRCVVVGGGLVGCEVALWLARMGKQVAVLEVQPALMSAGIPAPLPNMLMMLDMLKAENVSIYTGASFDRKDGDEIVFHDADGEHRISADSVIQSIGYRAEDALYQQLYETCSVKVWKVGDCVQPANVLEAVKGGYFVGNQV